MRCGRNAEAVVRKDPPATYREKRVELREFVAVVRQQDWPLASSIVTDVSDALGDVGAEFGFEEHRKAGQPIDSGRSAPGDVLMSITHFSTMANAPLGGPESSKVMEQMH